MKRRIGFLWRRHRLALLGFALALAVTLFFLVRLVIFALYWSDPAHRNQTPAGWMTLGYVARSWALPPEALAAALGVAPPDGRPETLAAIARSRGQPLEQFLAEVAIVIAQAERDREVPRDAERPPGEAPMTGPAHD